MPKLTRNIQAKIQMINNKKKDLVLNITKLESDIENSKKVLGNYINKITDLEKKLAGLPEKRKKQILQDLKKNKDLFNNIKTEAVFRHLFNLSGSSLEF